jgi:small subunit ribosomal protein S13
MLNRRKDYETGEDIHLLSSDLAFTQDNDIKMMKKMKSYKGMRHARGLTVRGQKTRANFRRNKGKVAGVQKKKAKTGKV